VEEEAKESNQKGKKIEHCWDEMGWNQKK